MKHLFTFLALILLSGNIYAQKVLPACPSVEWLRTVSDTTKYSIERTAIDSNQDFVVWGTYDYSPTPFPVAGLNVPPVPLVIGLNFQYFIMKTDSNGVGKWFIPLEVKRGGYKILDLKLDKDGNIYVVLDVVFSSTDGFRFLGQTYFEKDKVGIMIFKLNHQGQLLSNTFIEASDRYGTYKPSFITTSDSAVVMLLDAGWKYKVNNQMLDDSSLYYNVILKLSDDLNTNLWQKVAKVKRTGYNVNSGYSMSIMESVNHDLYLYGQCLNYDCEIQLDALTIKADFPKTTNYTCMNYFTKLDLKTGSPLWAKTFGSTAVTNNYNIILNVDAKDNVYLLGQFSPGTGAGYMLTLNNTTALNLQNWGKMFLLRYEPDSQKYAIMAFAPINKNGRIASLSYVPKTQRMIITGHYEGNDDFIVDSIRSDGIGVYVLSVNTEIAYENMSNYVEGVKKFEPEWLAYTKPEQTELSGGGRSQIFSLYYDNRGKIYLSGRFLKGNIFDRFSYSTVGSNTSDVYGYWHAKLGFLDNKIVKDTATLVAVQDSAFYQWVDCDNNNQPISGATNQRFSPKTPGNYGVLVSNAFCAVQSPCLFTMKVTERDLLQGVQIYPNPVSNTLYLANLPIGVDIAVFDVMGRKIFSSSVQQSSFKINTESWSQGVYLVQLNYQGERWMEKVVKN